VIGGLSGGEDNSDGSYNAASAGGKIKIASFTILGQVEQSTFEKMTINVGNIYRRYIDREGNSTFSCSGATQCNISGDTDLDTYYLGADWGLGNTTVHLRYGEQKWKVDKGAWDDETVTYTLLGVSHKFSKTTKVWAGWRESDFDNADAKVTVTSVGIVKDF